MPTDLIQLDIAGIRTALELGDGAMASRIRSRYAEFITETGHPQAAIRVVTQAGLQVLPVRGENWIIETELAGSRLTYRSHYDAGWADLESGAGLLEIASHAEVENFLRVLYAHLCLRAGGLMLHSAGVVRNGAGYLFFGPSGRGKSTTALLSMDLGYTVLSDDLVIVRKGTSVFRVYGLPFRGTFPETPHTRLDVPVAGVYSLVQDTELWVRSLTQAEGVARLAASVPFTMDQPAARVQVLAVCGDLTASCGVGELHFRRDAGFWRVIA